MNPLDQGSSAHSSASDEDLFQKLDQLITRHQRRPVHPLPDTPVPLLTEAIDAPADPEIPVLEEAVDLPSSLTTVESPLSEQSRHLQVALYLRLRQRLDEVLDAATSSQAAPSPPDALPDHVHDEIAAIGNDAAARLAQELRNALPTIVRESVEQVLGTPSSSDEG